MQSENDFSFSSIAEYLACGREIEFAYKGKQYSITNSGGYWNFFCDTEQRLIDKICPFEDRRALIAYAETCKIDGMPLCRIFDENRYDAKTVCIL